MSNENYDCIYQSSVVFHDLWLCFYKHGLFFVLGMEYYFSSFGAIIIGHQESLDERSPECTLACSLLKDTDNVIYLYIIYTNI